MKIQDTKEHLVLDEYYRQNTPFAYNAFVIEQGDTISTYPTVVSLTKLQTLELDDENPNVYSVQLNKDKTKLYLFADELDINNSTTTPEDFSIEGIHITDVELKPSNSNYTAIILTIESSDSITKDLLRSLDYKGIGLVDFAGNVLDIQNLNENNLRLNQDTEVTDVLISDDAQYIRLRIDNDNDNSFDDMPMSASINSSSINLETTSGISYLYDKIVQYFEVKNYTDIITPINDFDITISNFATMTDDIISLSTSSFSIAETPEIISAEYFNNAKELVVKLINFDTESDLNLVDFDIKIDGEIHRFYMPDSHVSHDDDEDSIKIYYKSDNIRFSMDKITSAQIRFNPKFEDYTEFINAAGKPLVVDGAWIDLKFTEEEENNNEQ